MPSDLLVIIDGQKVLSRLMNKRPMIRNGLGALSLKHTKKQPTSISKFGFPRFPPSERKEILLRKRGPEMPFLRYYWEQNVKSSMLSNYREILSEILSKFSKLDSDAKSDEA